MPKHFYALYAAYLGDIVGAPREFGANNTDDYNFDLFYDEILDPNTRDVLKYPNKFTDDSILTMAVAKGLRESRGKSDDEIEMAIAENIHYYGRMYKGKFPGAFGNDFSNWLKKEKIERPARGSWGDGALMRVSSAGWAYSSLKDTIHAADLTAKFTHDQVDSRRGAQAIAAAMHLARAGVDKQNIKLYLETQFGLDLSKTVKEFHDYNYKGMPHKGYYQTEGSLNAGPMALAAFFESDNYEDCIRKVVAMGGDSDTLGAIAGGLAGAYYGMPKWLEEECEDRLDNTLKAETKAFQEHIESLDTEPKMDEIEIALAKAKLEQHVLQQYNSNNSYSPAQDPEYLNLLAQMEATRLFHEEVNKARTNNDSLTEQTLLDNKKDLLAQLTEKLKDAPELKDEHGKMAECPVVTEDVSDCDFNKRYKNTKKLFPDQRVVVVHEKIRDRIIEDNSAIRDLLAESIKERKAQTEQKVQITEQVKALMQQTATADDGSTKTEEFYYGIMDGMLGKGGEIENNEALAGMADRLQDVMNDLRNMKERTDIYDPNKLSVNVLRKLNTLSNELTLEAVAQNSDAALQKIAFVNRLTDAVKGWRAAPEGKRISPLEYELQNQAPQYVSSSQTGEISLNDLIGRVPDLSGRASHFYKDMLSAIKNHGDLSALKKNSDKLKACEALAAAAEGYLKHKAPYGSVKGLTLKEKGRVLFAKNLKKFAKKAKEAIITKAAEAKKEKNNYISMSNFHAKCDNLVEKYNRLNAIENKTPEQQQAAEAIKNEIMNPDKAQLNFAEEYRNILKISDSYPKDHDMQAACATMLAGSVSAYMDIYFKLHNESAEAPAADKFAALGITADESKKAADISKIGKKVMDEYTKQKQPDNATKTVEPVNAEKTVAAAAGV